MAVWPWAGYLTSLVLKVLGHVRAHTISESCCEHHVCLCVKCLDPCLEPEKVLCDVSATVSLRIIT